ncbi:MAG: HRDC domain-containing protein [Sedimentisphaerales bacterium]|nr:HRDC domain-containing protein [Sedimentisphaerales bacterium]
MNNPVDCSFEYVDNAKSLDRLLQHLAGAEQVAIDTEADSLHHFYEKVCLIQLSLDSRDGLEGRNFIVDPLVDLDLSNLMTALAEKLLILHYADYDLRMLRRGFGFAPKNQVFDTMAAAELLGYESISLSALVARHFGVELSKTSKKSDWSRRPLTEKQLAYAVKDTCYLHQLMEKLTAELQAMGRLDWHRETCAVRVAAAMSDRPPADEDNCWRIRGLRSLNDRQLALVRAAWHWRQNEAQKVDLPPFKIAGNPLLIYLAVWACENHDLDFSRKRAPNLPRNCNGRRLGRLVKALRGALSLPKDQLPSHRPRRLPTAPPENFESLRAECAHLAQSLELPPSLVASRATLFKIAAAQLKSAQDMLENIPGLVPWQAKLIEQAVRKVAK